MNAIYTGNKILELRKQKGLSQKTLAEKLNVTDKAVSKWERGLNFPDLFVLEKLSIELDTPLIDLLGLDDSSKEDTAREITEMAKAHNIRLLNESIARGTITVIFGILLFVSHIYTSKLFADNDMYGMPQFLSLGMLGFIAITISNGTVSIRNGLRLKKYMK